MGGGRGGVGVVIVGEEVGGRGDAQLSIHLHHRLSDSLFQRFLRRLSTLVLLVLHLLQENGDKMEIVMENGSI